VLAALLQVIDTLSNINVRIPEFIQTGESADLTCSFNLGGDDLYSGKLKLQVKSALSPVWINSGIRTFMLDRLSMTCNSAASTKYILL
jgi:hypothetical protein